MADNNASGLVNAQDASGHGAAVIYPSSKINASDYFTVLNDRLSAEGRKRADDHAKAMAKENAAVKSPNAQGWTPFQADINKGYQEWQQIAGQYQNEKDYGKRVQLKQAMDISQQHLLNSVKFSADNQAAWKQNYDQAIKGELNPEDTKYVMNWATKMDAKAGVDSYVPVQKKNEDKFYEAASKLKAGKIKTGNQSINADGSVSGWSADAVDPIAMKKNYLYAVQTDPDMQDHRKAVMKVPITAPDGTQRLPTQAEVDEALATELLNDNLAKEGVDPASQPVVDPVLKKPVMVVGKTQTYTRPFKETEKDKEKNWESSSTTVKNAKYTFGLVTPPTKERTTSKKGINVDVTGETQGNETEITINSQLKGKNALHDFGSANMIYDAKTNRPVDIADKNGIPKAYATRTIDGKKVGGVVFEIPETKKSVSVRGDDGVTVTKKVTDTPQQYVFVADNEVITDISSKYGAITPNEILHKMGKDSLGEFGEAGAQAAVATPSGGVATTKKSSGGSSGKSQTFVVKGVTYNIPDDEVDAFKKEMKINDVKPTTPNIPKAKASTQSNAGVTYKDELDASKLPDIKNAKTSDDIEKSLKNIFAANGENKGRVEFYDKGNYWEVYYSQDDNQTILNNSRPKHKQGDTIKIKVK